MTRSFSDFLDKIWLEGGATGRTNKLNSIVVFPGVRRLGELVTFAISKQANGYVVERLKNDHDGVIDTMKPNSYYLGMQGINLER